jgi:cytochrome c peroxidase
MVRRSVPGSIGSEFVPAVKRSPAALYESDKEGTMRVVVGVLGIGLLLSVAVAVGVQARDLTPIEHLGKLIFFDTNLSTPPGQSCATCHDPATAFVGPISGINAHGAVYPGAVHVRFGNRKPPSAAYATFSPDFHYDEVEGLYVGGMFWDGRALNVVEQAKGPFLNPMEMNNPNKKAVITKVMHSGYSGLFRDVFGWGSLMDVESAYEYVAQAIAAYEGSPEVNRFTSKYDAYLSGTTVLTAQEMRGLVLFEGRAMCAACHTSQPGPGGEPPLLTDFTYDNLGAPKNLENPWYGMPPHFNPDREDWIDLGLGGVLGLPEEMGKVKVPTLRNVGMRPYEGFVQAYMHNGVFKSLHEVVDFYNTRDVGDWPPPEYPENVNTDELGNLGLPDEDVDDLVAFLMTLTDGYTDEPMRPLLPESQARTALLSDQTAFPNPFRTMLELRLSTQVNGTMSVGVYDPSGRRVRTLAAGVDASKTATLVWDGRTDAGASAPAGIYFLHVQSGAHRTIHKVLRLQ